MQLAEHKVRIVPGSSGFIHVTSLLERINEFNRMRAEPADQGRLSVSVENIMYTCLGDEISRLRGQLPTHYAHILTEAEKKLTQAYRTTSVEVA